MKICRFNGDRLGVIEDSLVVDITDVLPKLPLLKWPLEQGDHVIRHLPRVTLHGNEALRSREGIALQLVTLDTPVANPSKIIAAPLNYHKHVAEVGQDAEIHHNTNNPAFEGFDTPIDKLGLFLKANSSLCGPSGGVHLVHPDRRNDHEMELAVIVGQTVKDISEDEAMSCVAGYCIGLDMTVRGPEDRSFRKSPDSYTVLGPWMVTADEIADPGALPFHLSVNSQVRQKSTTGSLIVDIPQLISLASRWYTLHPGDIILTGTPDGVGPVKSGDTIDAWIDQVGEMRVLVH